MDKEEQKQLIEQKNISNVPTSELVKELRAREGVEFFNVLPHQDYVIDINDSGIQDSGPAVILKVID